MKTAAKRRENKQKECQEPSQREKSTGEKLGDALHSVVQL